MPKSKSSPVPKKKSAQRRIRPRTVTLCPRRIGGDSLTSSATVRLLRQPFVSSAKNVRRRVRLLLGRTDSLRDKTTAVARPQTPVGDGE
ncbi:hypothetical protein Droror1_Dr00009740, partial [Drosera rotundifolia]